MINITNKHYSFRDRSSEWILSLGLLFTGLAISTHPNLFFNNDLYKPLLNLWSQPIWAAAFTFTGLLRIVALLVNGLWRPTTHLRALGSAAGFTLWSTLFILAFISIRVRPTGVFTFGMLMAFELMALWWAAGDAKLIDQIAHRDKKWQKQQQ